MFTIFIYFLSINVSDQNISFYNGEDQIRNFFYFLLPQPSNPPYKIKSCLQFSLSNIFFLSPIHCIVYAYMETMNSNLITVPRRVVWMPDFKQHITNVYVSCMIYDIGQLQYQQTLESSLLGAFSRFSDHKTCWKGVNNIEMSGSEMDKNFTISPLVAQQVEW